MPKEFVESSDDVRVAVGWSSEQGVQLGVTTPGERSVFWQFLTGDDHPGDLSNRRLIELTQGVTDACDRYPVTDGSLDHLTEVQAESLIARGIAILNALDRQTNGPVGSLWFSFDDRRQVNHLIRLLRRARDSAFGRDE